MDRREPTVVELLRDVSLSLTIGQWKHVYGALVSWCHDAAEREELDATVLVTLNAVEQLLRHHGTEAPPSGWVTDGAAIRKAVIWAMATWTAAQVKAARAKQ